MKKFLVVFSLTMALMLFGCTKEETFSDDYPEFKGIKCAIEKVSYDEITTAFTDLENDYVIVLAFNPQFYECPYCKAVMPILNDVAISENVKVLYMDIYEIRMNNSKEYQLLLSFIAFQTDTNEELEDITIRNDKKTLVVPDVYVVSRGKILAHHVATIKDENGEYIKELDDENKDALKTIYENMIAMIKK